MIGGANDCVSANDCFDQKYHQRDGIQHTVREIHRYNPISAIWKTIGKDRWINNKSESPLVSIL